MRNIQAFLAGALAGTALFCSVATAQEQPQAKFDLLMREALSSAPGKDMTVTRLEVQPGYKANSHSHPGETFVYVVSGRILNQINDEEPKTFAAGEFFFEPANALHAQFVNESSTDPAVVIIVGIRPEGEN